MKSTETITISRKFIEALILGIAISVPSVILGWSAVADRYGVKAQERFNNRFDVIYPVKHAPCSTKVASMVDNIRTQQENIKEVKSKVDFLVMLEQRRMTWKEKNAIVESLVKNDSLSYDAAYELINSGKVP